MAEPFLPVDLEDDDGADPREWTIKALRALAAQLGVMNDFFYALIGAADMLEKGR